MTTIVLTTLGLGVAGYCVDKPKLDAMTEDEKKAFSNKGIVDWITSSELHWTVRGAAYGCLFGFVATQLAK